MDRVYFLEGHAMKFARAQGRTAVLTGEDFWAPILLVGDVLMPVDDKKTATN